MELISLSLTVLRPQVVTSLFCFVFSSVATSLPALNEKEFHSCYHLMSHHLVRNNPLLPYSCNIPGKGLYLLQYPHSLPEARKIILELPPSSSNRMRQCITCHRFVTGAVDASVDHSEGASGPLCALSHHPNPCPFFDRHGNPCQYHELV